MNYRDTSLDVFRGMAVAGMILVNTPGSWLHIYAPLKHSLWHGITITDLVFPFFLFAVGNSLFFSRGKAITNWETIAKATKRSFLLFGIGLFLNAYPFQNSIEELRTMGVLQRIAICYLLAVVLISFVPKRHLHLTTWLLLIIYWLTVGVSAHHWSLNGNFVTEIDLAILGQSHMYQGFGIPFEPEGLLSNLGALANVLFGYLTAHLMSQQNSIPDKVQCLLKTGTVLLLVGLCWSLYLPLNKPLWSSSYVLVSTACAQLALALILCLKKCRHLEKTLDWFQIYGSNPLLIYALAWLYAATMSRVILIRGKTETTSISEWLFDMFSTVLPYKLASLLYAIIAVTIFYALSKYLFDRKIFIKV